MAETRVIRYGDRELEMESGMSLEQAKELMARHFPELADPQVETKKTETKTVYVFSKKAGRKGARAKASPLAAAIRDLQTMPVETELIGKSVLSLAGPLPDGGIDQIAHELIQDYQEEIELVRGTRQALLAIVPQTEPTGSVL